MFLLILLFSSFSKSWWNFLPVCSTVHCGWLVLLRWVSDFFSVCVGASILDSWAFLRQKQRGSGYVQIPEFALAFCFGLLCCWCCCYLLVTRQVAIVVVVCIFAFWGGRANPGSLFLFSFRFLLLHDECQPQRGANKK